MKLFWEQTPPSYKTKKTFSVMCSPTATAESGDANMVASKQESPPEEENAPPPLRSVRDVQGEAELADMLKDENNPDWHLLNYDKETTVIMPNSTQDEAKRLMVLQSYNILDSDNEIEFDDLTREAAQVFDCPVAVVTLIDVGRQWYKAISGMPVTETPRCVSFCAHVVKRKENTGCLVVPDATKDERFKDNPLVTGGPQVRFYAGSPLVSPQGQVLGSFCVLDLAPRPQGLSIKQRMLLKSFAQQAVYHMITRPR